jgi:hypothetical protein
MAFLSSDAMTLNGGCLCTAIRYTIRIPPVESRPLSPNAALTPVTGPTGSIEQMPTKFPLIELDHCSSCRLAAGSIIQAWIVCPKSWVSWRLINRVENENHNKTVQKPNEKDYQPFTTSEIVNPSEELRKSTYLSHFMSSTDVHRGFCGRCGTSLTYCYTGPKPGWPLPERNFDVALGTLDREYLETEGVRPDRHGWWNDGVKWVKNMVRDGDVINGTRLIRHPTGATQTTVKEE